MFVRLVPLERLAYGLVSGLAACYCTSAFAQDTTVDPYILCAKSPYNSVCQLHHLNPVSLDDRPGEEALGCLLKIGGSDLQGQCRFSIDSGQFGVYIEEGQELESLGGKKPTRGIGVSTDNIVKLLYEEDTIENRPALLPPVRVARRVLRRPNEVSLISVIFPLGLANTALSAEGSATPEESVASSNVAPTTQQPQPVVVTLVVEQEVGGTVRSQLESVTGLPSEAPPAE